LAGRPGNHSQQDQRNPAVRYSKAALIGASGALRPTSLADYCVNGYRLPKLHGKPNPADARKSRKTGVSVILPALRRPYVYAAFIAMLKLPFKFDRS
jgi:hypothetical protein